MPSNISSGISFVCYKIKLAQGRNVSYIIIVCVFFFELSFFRARRRAWIIFWITHDCIFVDKLYLKNFNKNSQRKKINKRILPVSPWQLYKNLIPCFELPRVIVFLEPRIFLFCAVFKNRVIYIRRSEYFRSKLITKKQ